MSKIPLKPVRVMDIRGTYKGGGGPDKTVLQSAFKHNKDRVYVLVTYLRDPKDDEFQITSMAKALDINYAEVSDRMKLDFMCLFELHKLIKSHQLEIYHAHDDKTLLYGWLLKILNPKLKIIYTCHGNFPQAITYRNFLRHYFSLFLKKRYLKPIMAVSEACRRKLVSYGLKKEDIKILYNGVDIDKWRGDPILKEELEINSNGFLVGTVARIDPQKDFSTFLKVAELVIDRLPNTRFVVVGDGKAEELSELKEKAKQLGLNKKVNFTGHRNDIFNIYASLDVFLMTSIMEGLPNTVLEAMSMEIPVVSTAVSGVPELVVDNETGYLCGIGDFESLADRVIKLLGNKELRARFANAGRTRIEKYFSFTNRVKRLEDYYEYFRRLN